MARLPIIQTETAGSKTRQMLEGVQATLNMTPNFVRVMGNSPAVLESYLGFSGAMKGGSLPPKLAVEIALAVGQQNGSQYCVSAHTAIGKLTGLTEAEIEEARSARSHSPKEAAALQFARLVLAREGRMADDDFVAIKQAGFNDAEIAEIIAHVALNIFTNYFNSATQVEVDFPPVDLEHRA